MQKLSKGIIAVKQSGFTLIELVIVIVIIGILAAVAVPNFANVSDQAKMARNQAILGSVKSAYSVALSVNKSSAVTDTQVVAQQADPVCNAGSTGGDPTPTGTFNYVCGTAAINIPASPTTLNITCHNC